MNAWPVDHTNKRRSTQERTLSDKISHSIVCWNLKDLNKITFPMSNLQCNVMLFETIEQQNCSLVGIKGMGCSSFFGYLPSPFVLRPSLRLVQSCFKNKQETQKQCVKTKDQLAACGKLLAIIVDVVIAMTQDFSSCNVVHFQWKGRQTCFA